MKISAWGNYPSVDTRLLLPSSFNSAEGLLSDCSSVIPRGLGRSYGDSSLSSEMLDSKLLNRFMSFDADTGMVTCEAGVSLADILEVFVPKGWFLPVTPGTKFVTIGGAIASDVHGKNHHCEGSFSDHVDSIVIATGSQGVVQCSRTQHSELFYATCGGMGLTGMVLAATFKLRPINSSYINETVVKAKNLAHALELLEKYESTTYSVAWIDCLSTGENLGRSILMVGEHSEQGALKAGKKSLLNIPVKLPGFLLNQFSIQAFNFLYYHKVLKEYSEHHIHYEPFFYPLDGIHNWNNMYGKGGFTQYQFVIPKAAGLDGMTEILDRIAQSKRGSFLAVLKTFGKGNDNYLSFPMEGYTLALDFKIDSKLFPLLDELDKIVLKHGGRLYLTKDVRMSEDMFKSSYPHWEQFVKIKQQYDEQGIFSSLQSKRLGI